MKDYASAKDEAEKKRLFYVGATRARDRLILSGSLKEPSSRDKHGKPENMLKWLDSNTLELAKMPIPLVYPLRWKCI